MFPFLPHIESKLFYTCNIIYDFESNNFKGVDLMPSPVNDAVRKGDLTEGNVVRKLLLFSLPIVAGNLFMQLYNVVDSLVVGNFVGSDAIAAVGASFPIMMLFNALYMGISAGASVVICRRACQ